MIARVGDNIYSISLPNLNNVYLLLLNNNRLCIVNSTDGSSADLLIQSLLEIKTRFNASIEYLILTDCRVENTGGGWIIYEIFKPKVIAHYPDSISIRHGECKGRKYNPLPISIEIRDKVYILNNEIILINSKTPTAGSMIIKYKDYIISGFVEISPFELNVKYICNPKECRKVEKFVRRIM
ncbi:MAG: MBL fold metallo-hydrolase [Sulfolobaceae archaeon]